jgi:hypothetical protein
MDKSMTRDEVFDLLVQRVIEVFRDDKTAATERARAMVNSWTWVSENSDNGSGHLTIYDWLDGRIADLLDQDELLRMGDQA